MAISYPLTLPAVQGIARIAISAQCTTGFAISPFTGEGYVQQFDGQFWLADVTLPLMSRADADDWKAFLLKLKGRYGTFLLGDPSATSPKGTATGTPLVNGASQTGTSLITDGWSNSITGILQAGDYIQLGNRLYCVLDDADSDGSGNATFEIFPPLRESPGDNDSLVLSNTVGLFRLSSDVLPVVQSIGDGLYSLAFSAIEAI